MGEVEAQRDRGGARVARPDGGASILLGTELEHEASRISTTDH